MGSEHSEHYEGHRPSRERGRTFTGLFLRERIKSKVKNALFGDTHGYDPGATHGHGGPEDHGPMPSNEGHGSHGGGKGHN